MKYVEGMEAVEAAVLDRGKEKLTWKIQFENAVSVRIS